MNDEIWTEWIDHDGLGCPVPAGALVQVIGEAAPAVADKHGRISVQQGVALSDTGEAWDWRCWGRIRVVDNCRLHCGRVLAYRCRVYRAGSDLIARFATAREDA